MTSISSLHLTAWLRDTQTRYGALYTPVLKHAGLNLLGILAGAVQESSTCSTHNHSRPPWALPQEQCGISHDTKCPCSMRNSQHWCTHTPHALWVTQAEQEGCAWRHRSGDSIHNSGCDSSATRTQHDRNKLSTRAQPTKCSRLLVGHLQHSCGGRGFSGLVACVTPVSRCRPPVLPCLCMHAHTTSEWPCTHAPTNPVTCCT